MIYDFLGGMGKIHCPVDVLWGIEGKKRGKSFYT